MAVSRLRSIIAGAALTSLASACSDAPSSAPIHGWTPEFARGQGRPTGTKIVRVDQASKAEVTEAIMMLGGRIERSYQGIGVLAVRGISDAQAAELARVPGVEGIANDVELSWIPPRAQENYRILAGGPRRNGPATLVDQSSAVLFNQYQWNLRVTSVPQTWAVTNAGQGALVCILDTGIDERHVDLAGKVNTAISKSFVASEPSYRDGHYHGTFVAGVIATNGVNIASAANRATLCAVKVLDASGDGSFNDMIAGIMYAAEIDADVINLSLGAYFDRLAPGAATLIAAQQAAVDFAYNRGTFIVTAAGNTGANLANDGTNIAVPCELQRVMCVGATGPTNQTNFDALTSYTAYGPPGVDVMAPGGELLGVDATDALISTCAPNLCGGFADAYLIATGTSFAAPLVSAIAAITQAHQPGVQTPRQIQDCIFEGTDRITGVNIDPFYSKGRVNALGAATCTRLKRP
jgi:subtilisin family serine protease